MIPLPLIPLVVALLGALGIAAERCAHEPPCRWPGWIAGALACAVAFGGGLSYFMWQSLLVAGAMEGQMP